MSYTVPLLCLVVPLIAAVVAIRKGRGWLPVAMAAGFGLVLVWATIRAAGAQGWDEVGYGLVALTMAAPGLLGVGLGALIAWWQGRKRPPGSS